MLNKIYLIVLAAFALVMLVLTYFSRGWLSSIDNPRTVVANYEYYSNFSATFLWISALVLLVFANIAFWKTRKIWAFWTTLIYFAVFVVVNTFWLNNTLLEYQRAKGLLVGSYSLSPFFGAGLCVVAAFVVFANQFIAAKLHDKMFPPVEVESQNEKDSTGE
jgi:hypothetical protein